MIDDAVKQTGRNVPAQDIYWSLIDYDGCPEALAYEIATGVESRRKATVRESAKGLLGQSVAALGAGIGITAWTIEKGGGFVIVAWGLMLYGAVNLYRALASIYTGDIPD